MLSLIHFDSPDDANGKNVLINLWEYLAGCNPEDKPSTLNIKKYHPDPVGARHALPLQQLCNDLITLGERNFLWFWRNSMLLQWRRGVRGLEYNTLFIMMKEIAERMSTDDEEKYLNKFSDLLNAFIQKARILLFLERQELQKGNLITYDRSDNPDIQKLRAELFSDSKSHGGMFKELINAMDEVLIDLLIKEK